MSWSRTCAQAQPLLTATCQEILWSWLRSVQPWALRSRRRRVLSPADLQSSIPSIINIFGAEIGPCRQGEHDQIAKLDEKPAGHISPQDRIADKVDKGHPVAGGEGKGEKNSARV